MVKLTKLKVVACLFLSFIEGKTKTLRISFIIFFVPSIFFEPESFYMKPDQLEGQENGGVAIVQGKV